MPGLQDTPVWKRLQDHADETGRVHLKDLLQDGDRCAALLAEHNGILLDFARERVSLETMDLLFDLAEVSLLAQKRSAMYSGEHVNVTEGRAVMHMALRSPREFAYHVDGENVVDAVHGVLDRIYNLSERIRSGQLVGITGSPIRTALCIGIGGSFLGTEFFYEALRHSNPVGIQLKFLSNIDPACFSSLTATLDPESTIIIVISKTFTTRETMMNAALAKDWLVSAIHRKQTDEEEKKSAASKPKVKITSSKATAPVPITVNLRSVEEITNRHFFAVSTSNNRCHQFGIPDESIFGFWDWVGGRYSVSSSVGMFPLCLSFGSTVVIDILAGMHDIDVHFLTSPLRSNIPVLMALLSIWNSNFLGLRTTAILPYCHHLGKFVEHIQQLDMESNGKCVGIDGSSLVSSSSTLNTGGVIFGGVGTCSQHSFFQLLHQSANAMVQAEFIMSFNSPSASVPLQNSYDELVSNLLAQPDALACGTYKKNVPSHQSFPGNRPSMILLIQSEVTPFRLGQLLAIYEHRTAAMGFIWGINSFDQFGVELGKNIAQDIRNRIVSCRETGELDCSGMNKSTSGILKRCLRVTSRQEEEKKGV